MNRARMKGLDLLFLLFFVSAIYFGKMHNKWEGGLFIVHIDKHI